MANITPSHADQLQVPEYRNWVKAGLAPKYLKEGIQKYIDDEFKSILISFLTDICRHLGITEAKCTSCTTANILPCPTYGICNLRQTGGICKYHVRGDPLRESKTCPNKVCDKLFVKIINLHRFHYPSWRNTDAQKWCTHHWEIAKCFLSATGYEVKPSAGETDCSGILNIAVNCLSFGNCFNVNLQPPNAIISKIIQSRNDVVHSATLKITDDQLKDYIDLMIALLEDKKALATNIDAQTAIRKLTQLKDCKFSITPKDEEDIRAEGAKAAEQKKKDDYQGRKKVPVSPPLDELTENVDDVFVKLVIREDLIHDPRKTHKTGKGKKVDNLIDIFCSHRNDNICKNMYVVGNAGMGKTTWCMKLLSTWVSAHIKFRDQSNVTDILNKDEKMMLEFDIVFYVSLRHALSQYNIRDMIKNQLFGNRPNLDALTSEVLEKEPEKCLVIIDGLDEWNPPENSELYSQSPGLPSKRDLYDCPCLTTTRPWKLEELRLPTNKIDLAVTIEGLDDKRLLAERVIQIRQRNVDDKTAKERTIANFTTYLEALSFKPYTAVWNQLNFIRIPLILVFIVNLWFDSGKLETTWAGTFCGFLECLILKAEGDKRRRRMGRLHTVEGIEALNEEWKKDYFRLPKILHKTIVIKYSSLFLKLGKLAFNSLVTTEPTEKLVFSDQTLKITLLEKDMEVAVKIGILCQSKVVGEIIEPKSSLSFLHKTIQEYFAALYICSYVQERCNSLQKIKAFCSDQLCINKMENVILFVYGLDPKTANILSQHIAYIQLKQGRVLDENLAHKCRKELEDNPKVKELNSYIACIYGAIIEDGNILKLTNLNWAYLQKLTIHLNHDKKNQDFIAAPEQLHAVSDTLKWSQLKETDSKSRTYRLLKTESSQTNIQEIDLSQIEHLQEIDLSQIEHLHEVSLKNIEYCKVLLNSKELRCMTFTKTKRCTFIIQHNISLDHILSLTDYTDLGRIIVDSAEDCTVHVLSLSKTTDLTLRNCNSCTIELQTNQIVDSRLTDNGSDFTTSSYTMSTHLNIRSVDIDRCKSCELKIEVVNQYPTTEIVNSEQLKYKQRLSDKPWLVNIIKFLECESCKLSVAVSDTPVTVLDNEDLNARSSVKSNNKTAQINTLSFEKSNTCELNIYSAIQKGKFVNFDNARNEITYKSSDECIIRNLELSNSSLCELKLRNIKTRKEQNDLTLYDPSLVVDFIHIHEVYCTDAGKEKQLSLSVRNGQSKTRNQVQAEILSVSRSMQNANGRIPNALKPIEHLKEISIGNVSKEVPLAQIFKSMTSLEKLYLKASIQSEMTFPFEPQILQNKNIEANMIQPISSIPHLKCLVLSGLSVDAYKCAANVLPKMKIEELVISNSNIEIPECFIRSIQSLTILKCLNLRGLSVDAYQHAARVVPTMKRIEQLVLSNSNIEMPECFIRSIQSLKSLKYLDLNGLSVDAYQHAARVLPTMKLIEELVISNCNIPIPESIVRSIQSLKRLKYLTLHSRHIEHVPELVTKFSIMTQTETLNISSTEDNLLDMYTFSNGHLIPFKNNVIWGKTRKHAEKLAKHTMNNIKKYDMSIKHADILKFAISALQTIVNLEHLTLDISGEAFVEFKALAESQHSLKEMHTFELFARDNDISEYVNKNISYFNNLKHLTLEGRSITQLENLAMVIKYSMTQLETLKLSARDTDLSKYVTHSIEMFAHLKHFTLEGQLIENIGHLAIRVASFLRQESLYLSARRIDIDIDTSSIQINGVSAKQLHYQPKWGEFNLSMEYTDIPHIVCSISGRLTEPFMSPFEYFQQTRSCTHLKHLSLDGIQLQNIEPLDDILPKLRQLKTLILVFRDKYVPFNVEESINDCEIVSFKYLISFLSEFKRLKTLTLSSRDSDISGYFVESIGRLDNLKHLTLNGREIQKVETLVSILLELRQLVTLKLSFGDTDIPRSVVESIRYHVNLKFLTLEGKQIENVECFANVLLHMTQLETLKLSSRETDIPGSVVESIEMLFNLKHLTLEVRQIQYVECFANFLLDMTQLETLQLSSRDSDIPGYVLASMRMLFNLKHLTLEGRRIENVECLADFLLHVTQLETLNLSSGDTDIPGSVVKSIRNHINLKHLTLGGRQIEKDFLLDMTQSEIVKLLFGDTDVSWYVVKLRLPHLKHLTLEAMQIQMVDVLIFNLPTLTQLETLKLSSRDYDIPRSVLTYIENDTCLKILNFDGRSLECARVNE